MSKRDIVAALAESEAPGASGFIRVHCPWCEEQGHQSSIKNLAINPETGWYGCWRAFDCGTRGWLWNNEDFTYSSAYTATTHIKAVPLQKQLGPPEPDDIKGFKLLVPGSKGPQMQQLAYLRKRRVAAATITEAGLGYTTDDWKYEGCVIAPLTSYKQQRGYFGSICRSIVGKDYKNTPGLQRDAMFNEHALWANSDEPLAIVEGVFDALPHWPFAVACQGKPSDAQVALLAMSPRPLVLMLDADARADAYDTQRRLRMRGKDTRIVHLPPGEDPGTTSVEDFINYLFEETHDH